LAEDARLAAKQQLDEAEDISIRLFTVDEVLDMIYSGKLQDGKTVAGILAYTGRKK
jgi:ADP-ribose pyrophosphatase